MGEQWFDRDEYELRWKRARQVMDREDLDALVAYSHPANQFWLTGYHGYESGDRYVGVSRDVIFPKVLIGKDRGPLLIGIKMARDSYATQTPCEDIRTYRRDEEAKRVSLLADALRSWNIQEGSVGITLSGESSISVREFQRLKNGLEGIKWKDATNLFRRLRMKKTPTEIKTLRVAARLQTRAFEWLSSRSNLKSTPRELPRKIKQAQVEAGADDFGLARVMDHPAWSLSSSSFDPLQNPREPVRWIDCGVGVKGYHSNISCVVVQDGERSSFEKVYEQLKVVYEQGLRHFKPGRRVREIARDVVETIELHGENDPLDGRFIGHNLGYRMIEKPWLGLESPEDLRLEENMVLAPEWFVETPYGPMVYENDFVVTEDGLQRLNPDAERIFTVKRENV